MRYSYENIDTEVETGTVDRAYFTVGLYTNPKTHQLQLRWDNYPLCNQVTMGWTEQGRFAGIVQYNSYLSNDVKRLDCQMIWVDKRYRGQGVSRDMMQITLAVEEPQVVEVFCISRASLGLFQSLEKQFPDIRWHIDYDVEGLPHRRLGGVVGKAP